jgi:hypothetical protein
MMPPLAGLDPSGSLREALDRLQRTPSDYYKMLYVDTAMFGSEHGVKCVVDFFGSDRVLFGTDTPFDAQAGSYFIPRTTADIEGAIDNEADRDAIFKRQRAPDPRDRAARRHARRVTRRPGSNTAQSGPPNPEAALFPTPADHGSLTGKPEGAV